MGIFIYSAILIIGFVLLIIGSDFLVDGAASLARKFNVSNLVIGLTVVSIATSFPELVVTIQSNLMGKGDLAVANIVGSNISNILLILGIVAIIFKVRVRRNTVLTEIPIAILASAVVYFLANDFLANGLSLADKYLYLSRADGVVLLAFFSVFLYYTYKLALASNHGGREAQVFEEDSLSMAGYIELFFKKYRKQKRVLTIGEVNAHSVKVSVILVVIGLAMLVGGGNFIVKSALSIADFFNIPSFIIGITVVSIGTSLPELATCITAFRKNKGDLAVGNIVGSNIFNTLFVLGITSTIAPLKFSLGFNFDMVVVFLSTTTLFGIVYFTKKHRLSSVAGMFFIWSYFLYILFKVFI